MRLMKRNQTAIYYCLYKGKEPLLDEDGNETSEYRVLYERPVKLMCSVSHATGYTIKSWTESITLRPERFMDIRRLTLCPREIISL